MEYFTVIKINSVLLSTRMWVDRTDILLRKEDRQK